MPNKPFLGHPSSLLNPSRFSDFLPLGDVGAAVGGFVGRVGGALLGRASPKTGAPAAPTYSSGLPKRCLMPGWHQGKKPWVYMYIKYIYIYEYIAPPENEGMSILKTWQSSWNYLSKRWSSSNHQFWSFQWKITHVPQTIVLHSENRLYGSTKSCWWWIY